MNTNTLNPKLRFWHSLRIAFGTNRKSEDMAIAILILLVCGGLYILYRMLCGFVNLMSNSKKLKR